MEEKSLKRASFLIVKKYSMFLWFIITLIGSLDPFR